MALSVELESGIDAVTLSVSQGINDDRLCKTAAALESIADSLRNGKKARTNNADYYSRLSRSSG